MLRRIRERLMPQAAERDQGFAQEILSLSHLGLRITGWAQIIIPVVMMAAQYLIIRDSDAITVYLVQGSALMGVGLLTLTASRLESCYEHSRLLSLLSVFISGVILVIAGLYVVVRVPGTGHYIPGRITGVMMLVVAVLPLLPLQTFALGAGIGACYFAALQYFQRFHHLGQSELNAYDHVFMGVIALIATGLTAVVYEQRSANYRSYITALRASMDLRRAQSQMLLSESAASLGRLAAALSHELNTPLGVVRSAVETLASLGPRLVVAEASQQQRLLQVQGELYRSMLTSVDRLREIIGRIQRYTNLDRAEVQVVELTGLLRDVVALHKPVFEGKARVELDLSPVPPLVCRPQLLSAVFSNLLTNAVEACNGNGHVVVSARRKEQEAEIVIRDNGRGMSQRELASIFDPGFRVEKGKMATGNWSLFGARQIVNEHGGEIRIESREGAGTVVSVTLPIPPRTATEVPV